MLEAATKHLFCTAVFVTIFLNSLCQAFGEGCDQICHDLEGEREELKISVPLQDNQNSFSTGFNPWREYFDITLGVATVTQASSGVSEGLSERGDRAAAAIAFDLEIGALKTERGEAYSLIEFGIGAGIDRAIPSLSGFYDEALEGVQLTELWYEHFVWGEQFKLRAGKLDLSADFDTNQAANCGITQFASSGFVNSLTLGFPSKTGLGGMALAQINPLWEVGLGLVNGDSQWETSFDAPFSIAEIRAKPQLVGLQGDYRFYGWFNGADHQHLRAPDRGGLDNYGLGLSFDQQVSRKIVLFARYGGQDQRVAQIVRAWSMGLQYEAGLSQVAQDRLGLAYGKAHIGKDWKSLDRENDINSSNEHHIELYYSWPLAAWGSIAPNLQWVENPEGNRRNGDVWMVGFRLQAAL